MSERNIRIETEESSGGELDSAVGAHSGSNWLKSTRNMFNFEVISRTHNERPSFSISISGKWKKCKWK